MKLADLKVRKRVWLEYNGKPLLGKGRYSLLKSISSTRSLKKSAKLLKICDKTAYNYIQKIEKRINAKIIKSYRGGKTGGGHTILTPAGRILIKRFEEEDGA